MNFNTCYNRVRPAPLVEKCDAITQQHFADQCNINNIMHRYKKTGILGTGIQGNGKPMFGDFSTVTSFQDAQNQIIQANEAFMSLPAAIRKRFDNNAGELIKFLENVENKAEAVALGLIEAPVSTPVTASISEESVQK